MKLVDLLWPAPLDPQGWRQWLSGLLHVPLWPLWHPNPWEGP